MRWPSRPAPRQLERQRRPNYATPPYISVAVPLGTPVGTYSQRVRMFEGLDTGYDPLIGPT